MQIARIQDSGGGVLNNRFYTPTVGKYITLAFLCLLSLSTIGLAISTGILDYRYKLLRSGYQTQSNSLQQCIKVQQYCPDIPVLKCSSTYVIKGLYKRTSDEEEEEFIKYVKIGIPDLTETEIEEYISYIPGLQSASIEKYDGEITSSYNTLEVYPDGSLIIGAIGENGQPTTDLEWGLPYTMTSIKSTVSIIGNNGVVVNGIINTTDTGIYVNSIISGDGYGVYVNNNVESEYTSIHVGGSVTSKDHSGIYVGGDVISNKTSDSCAISIDGSVTSIGMGISIGGSVSASNNYGIQVNGNVTTNHGAGIQVNGNVSSQNDFAINVNSIQNSKKGIKVSQTLSVQQQAFVAFEQQAQDQQTQQQTIATLSCTGDNSDITVGCIQINGKVDTRAGCGIMVADDITNNGGGNATIYVGGDVILDGTLTSADTSSAIYVNGIISSSKYGLYSGAIETDGDSITTNGDITSNNGRAINVTGDITCQGADECVNLSKIILDGGKNGVRVQNIEAQGQNYQNGIYVENNIQGFNTNGVYVGGSISGGSGGTGINVDSITADIGVQVVNSITAKNTGVQVVNSITAENTGVHVGSIYVDYTQNNQNTWKIYGVYVDGSIYVESTTTQAFGIQAGSITASGGSSIGVNVTNDITGQKYGIQAGSITATSDTGIKVTGNIGGNNRGIQAGSVTADDETGIGIKVTGDISGSYGIQAGSVTATSGMGVGINVINSITCKSRGIKAGSVTATGTSGTGIEVNSITGGKIGVNVVDQIESVSYGVQVSSITAKNTGVNVDSITADIGVQVDSITADNTGVYVSGGINGDVYGINVDGDVSVNINVGGNVGALTAQCAEEIIIRDGTCLTNFQNDQTSITGINSTYIDTISVSIPVDQQQPGYIGSITTTGYNIGSINVQSAVYEDDGTSYKLGGNVIQGIKVIGDVGEYIKVTGDVGGDNTVQAISVSGPIQCGRVNNNNGSACVQLGSINTKGAGASVNVSTLQVGDITNENGNGVNITGNIIVDSTTGDVYGIYVANSIKAETQYGNAYGVYVSDSIIGQITTQYIYQIDAGCVENIKTTQNSCITNFKNENIQISGIGEVGIDSVTYGQTTINNIQDSGINSVSIGQTTINNITNDNIQSISTNSIGGDNIPTAINIGGNVNCVGDNEVACINIDGQIYVQNINGIAINVAGITGNYATGIQITSNETSNNKAISGFNVAGVNIEGDIMAQVDEEYLPTAGVSISGGISAGDYAIYVNDADGTITSGSTGIYINVKEMTTTDVAVQIDANSISSDGSAIEITSSNGIVSSGTAILIAANISSTNGNAIQVGQEESTQPTLYQLNSTSGYGFVLFGDTHSKQGIRIAKSGELSDATTMIVGGSVSGDIKVDSNVNGNINIGGSVSNGISITNDVTSEIYVGGSIIGVNQNNKVSENPVYALQVGGNIQGNVDTLNIVGGDLTSLSVTSITDPADSSSTVGGNVGGTDIEQAIFVVGNVQGSIQIGGSVNGNIYIKDDVGSFEAQNVNNVFVDQSISGTINVGRDVNDVQIGHDITEFLQVNGNIGGDGIAQAVLITGSIQCLDENDDGSGACVQLGSIEANGVSALQVGDITSENGIGVNIDGNIYTNQNGIQVSGYIDSTGDSGSAISVAGNLTSNGYNTVYLGGNVTNTKIIDGSITSIPKVIYIGENVTSNGDGMFVNGSINVSLNGITVNGSVYTDLFNVNNVPKQIQPSHPEEIGAIVINESVISGEYYDKLFYNSTDNTCFNFTYDSDDLTLYNFTNYQEGDNIPNPNICRDISNYRITSDELISAMLTFTTEDIDKQLAEQLNEQPNLIFNSSFMRSNDVAIKFSATNSNNNTLQSIFAYSKPTDNSFTNILNVNLDNTLIGLIFLTANDYSAISIIHGSVSSGGYGIQIPTGNIASASNTALYVGNRIINDVIVENSINGDINVGGGSVDGQIIVGGSVTNGISVTGGVTGEIYVGSDVNGNINIAGNIMYEGSSIALLVQGYVQGGGDPVVYLGGIENNQSTQTLQIGNTSLDDGVSVKGRIYIEGDVKCEGNTDSSPCVNIGGQVNVQNANIDGILVGSITGCKTGVIITGDISASEYGVQVVGDISNVQYGVNVTGKITASECGVGVKSITSTNTGIKATGVISGGEYGIYADSVSGGDYGIHALGSITSSSSNGISISADSVASNGTGIYIDGPISGINGIYADSVTATSGIGINISGQVQGSGSNNPVVQLYSVTNTGAGQALYVNTSITGHIEIGGSVSKGISINNDVTGQISVGGNVKCESESDTTEYPACINIGGQINVQNRNIDGIQVGSIIGCKTGVNITDEISNVQCGVYANSISVDSITSNAYGINVGTIAVETSDGYYGYGINVVDSITSNLYGVYVENNINGNIVVNSGNVDGYIQIGGNVKCESESDTTEYPACINIGGQITVNNINLNAIQVNGITGNYSTGIQVISDDTINTPAISGFNAVGVNITGNITAQQIGEEFVSGTRGVNVTGSISASNTGVYVRDDITGGQFGISAGSVTVNSDIGTGIEVFGPISGGSVGIRTKGITVEAGIGIDVDGNIIVTRGRGIQVDGQIQGNRNNDAVVQLGGIENTGTGQALQIGDAALGDGSSVKGSVQIDGQITVNNANSNAFSVGGISGNYSTGIQVTSDNANSPAIQGFNKVGVSISGNVKAQQVIVNGQEQFVSGTTCVNINGDISASEYGVYVGGNITDAYYGVYVGNNINASEYGVYVGNNISASNTGVYVGGDISNVQTGVNVKTITSTKVGIQTTSVTTTNALSTAIVVDSISGAYCGIQATNVTSTQGTGINVNGFISGAILGIQAVSVTATSGTDIYIIQGARISNGGNTCQPPSSS